MGFWDITKRMIQGKPGFEAPQQDNHWDDDAPTDDFAEDRAVKREQAKDRGLFDQHGTKHIPVVEVTQTRYILRDANIEVWSNIRNQSDRTLELDRIMLLGVRHDLDYPLPPGHQREFRVYTGPRPNHGNYKKAELYYKDVGTGDYFRADHIVEYKYENDKTYSVNELRLITPIYDV